ncbi:isopentenyl-diphosphate delta-isomerase [Cnuella takakiae]|uniref:Isopentenyl-diphosphate delta-isomerase n=1 Tax=Cnuella takakiae TaxID=1302690 RepID=A0A1M5DST9_9BACT|nr:isopentenyl-diphosphate Delta-isomerase [Cnuella takakiae]OLY93880.1 isopentenyl-diphosphate delta-isomerase [Cnuella takakiae]SHF69995.1 isopentenyl-diphosphate delta-isomerase [Cnuella takakiae]
MEQPIVLVNEQDEPIGTGEKMDVHRKGLLHRAFSVFLFDAKGRMLLQQRALTKYHGGGLWTNACCSHPYPGELPEHAAVRRTAEELGITPVVNKLFHFIYKAEVENGLVEHELDHVFTGQYEGALRPDTAEVADYCYMEMAAIAEALAQSPERFTAWFRLIFPRMEQWWMQQYGALQRA